MKLMRKSLMVFLVVLFMLTVGAFAVGCSSGTITLSFETNGGPAVDDITVKKRAEVMLPEAGTWEDHEFGGWFLNSELTGTSYAEKQTIVAPDDNTTYYAKWDQVYTVTLNLNGGSGVDVTTLKLKSGANLYNALNGKTPTKSGLTFGAWFFDGAEITSAANNTMPAKDIEVKAEWKVEYTVNIYLQNEERNGYAAEARLRTTGLDYVDAAVTVTPNVVTGYEFNEDHPSNTTHISKLLEDSSKNVFNLYYDRGQYRVFYSPNVPEGYAATGSLIDGGAYYYGEKHTVLENSYLIDGCRFAGWVTDSGESVKTGDEITVGGTITIKAQWDIGLIDYSGTGDILYLPRDNSEQAIINRGGLEFVGTRTGETFTVTLPGGQELKGTVLASTVFYYTPNVKTGVYKYKAAYGAYYTAMGKDAPVDPDAANYKLTVNKEDLSDVTLEIWGQTIKNVPMVPFFDLGYLLLDPASGQSYAKIDLMQGETENDKYFMIVGQTEFSLMNMTLYLMAEFTPSIDLQADRKFEEYNDAEKVLRIDGRGGITLIAGRTDEDGEYKTLAEIDGCYAIEETVQYGEYRLPIFKVVLKNENGEGYDTEHAFEFLCYPYSQSYYLAVEKNELSGVFTPKNNSNGTKLTLAGYGPFVPAKYGNTEGEYYGDYSEIYGTIVVFKTATGTMYYFALDLENETYELVTAEDADKYNIVRRTGLLEFDLVTYTPGEGDEDGEYVVGDYVIVLNANSDEAKIYHKSNGTVDYNSPTATGTYASEPLANGNDLYTFTSNSGSFTFITTTGSVLVDDRGYIRNTFVVMSENGTFKGTTITGEAGKIEYRDFGYYAMGAMYTDPNGKVYEGGFLVFDDDQTYFHETLSGVLAYGDYNTGDMGYKYFTWNKSNDGLMEVEAENPLRTINSHGTIDEEITLSVRLNNTTGDIEAVYIEGDKKTYGTITEQGRTDYGSTLNSFESKDGSVKFNFSISEYTIGAGEQYVVWTKQAAKYSGTYRSGKNTFVLDGYDHATYTGVGYNLEGAYILSKDNADGTTPVYYMGYDSVAEQYYYFYFVLNSADNTFYEVDAIYQGDAHMKIVKLDDSELDYTVWFDGLGNVKIYDKSGAVAGEGTYDRILRRYLEAKITLTSAVGDDLGTEFTLGFSDYTEDDGEWARTAILKETEGERCYVSQEGVVIWLNGYGNIKITYADGTVVEGKYTLDDTTLTVTVEAKEEDEEAETIIITLTGKLNSTNYDGFAFESSEENN